MFEPGELGDPHICDTGSHQKVANGLCAEREVLPDSASPTRMVDGVGLSLGPGVHETASCQMRQPGDRKARRVDFITLSTPKTAQGSKAEDLRCSTPMDHS